MFIQREMILMDECEIVLSIVVGLTDKATISLEAVD
jgi:hypothetical protein